MNRSRQDMYSIFVTASRSFNFVISCDQAMRNFLPVAGALALTAIEVPAFLYHRRHRSSPIELRSAVEKHLSASDINSRLIEKLKKIKAKDADAKLIRRQVSYEDITTMFSNLIKCSFLHYRILRSYIKTITS